VVTDLPRRQRIRALARHDDARAPREQPPARHILTFTTAACAKIARLDTVIRAE
jgi:hypothetical protein